MPVLDKIKEAEKLAEDLKEEARKQVSEKLVEVNNKNFETTKQMFDDARLEIKKLNEENNNYLIELTNKSIAECQEINLANENLAKVHLNETVEFILKKVIDS